MNPHERLFDINQDFLNHTLNHAESKVDEKEVVLDNGCRVRLLDLGVLQLDPPEASAEQLVISAGVHGNETAPIEVCNRLVSEILAGEWTVRTQTLLIFGNPIAMVAGERFMDYNLNRLFAGTHDDEQHRGTREAARAKRLEALVEDFADGRRPLFHYDLHTAIRPSKREKFALYPFVPGREVPEQQVAFLKHSDVHTLLLQHREGTTFASWTSSHFGAESFTIELGKVRPFGQNELSRFAGIENSLRELLQGHWPQAEGDVWQDMVCFEVVTEILRTGDDFRFHIPDNVPNFTEYPPGTLIWEDSKQRHEVGDKPEAIVFPNPYVPVGQRVGLLVRRRD
ncbi:succinylglutamate desuccinylase [Marinobacteraceae bacterium S3BR75-40.1]